MTGGLEGFNLDSEFFSLKTLDNTKFYIEERTLEIIN